MNKPTVLCTGWGGGIGPDLPIDNRYMLSTVCISMGGLGGIC